MCQFLHPGNAVTGFGAAAGNRLIVHQLEAEREERASVLGLLFGYFQLSLINDSGSLLQWVTSVLVWAPHAPATMPVAAPELGSLPERPRILRLPARCVAGD